MPNIYELDFTSGTLKTGKGRWFRIHTIKINKGELCVSWPAYNEGYCNFVREIKAVKRRLGYNKKVDSFYAYNVTNNQSKLLESVSSKENIKKEEGNNMQELNFAQTSAIEVLQRMVKAAEGDDMTVIGIFVNKGNGVTTIKFKSGRTVSVKYDGIGEFDVHKGIAMALAKAAFGSKILQSCLLSYQYQKSGEENKKEKKARQEKKRKKADEVLKKLHKDSIKEEK